MGQCQLRRHWQSAHYQRLHASLLHQFGVRWSKNRWQPGGLGQRQRRWYGIAHGHGPHGELGPGGDPVPAIRHHRRPAHRLPGQGNRPRRWRRPGGLSGGCDQPGSLLPHHRRRLARWFVPRPGHRVPVRHPLRLGRHLLVHRHQHQRGGVYGPGVCAGGETAAGGDVAQPEGGQRGCLQRGVRPVCK